MVTHMSHVSSRLLLVASLSRGRGIDPAKATPSTWLRRSNESVTMGIHGNFSAASTKLARVHLAVCTPATKEPPTAW